MEHCFQAIHDLRALFINGVVLGGLFKHVDWKATNGLLLQGITMLVTIPRMKHNKSPGSNKKVSVEGKKSNESWF